MNERLIVDASIIVKAVVAETDSDRAARLWASGRWLGAPAHAVAEVGEALRRKRTRGEIGEPQLQAAVSALPAGVAQVPLTVLFVPAMDLARTLRISFYDSLYLAAAVFLDCVCVTADEKLLAAAAPHLPPGRLLHIAELASSTK